MYFWCTANVDNFAKGRLPVDKYMVMQFLSTGLCTGSGVLKRSNGWNMDWRSGACLVQSDGHLFVLTTLWFCAPSVHQKWR